MIFTTNKNFKDFTEPRCAGATIHFMDELILMEKMMEEMFSMDDVEQVEELDIKKGIFIYTG